MLTLTTPYGTFEAETEKQLLAKARKAKKAAEKQEAIETEARRIATMKAESIAYRYVKRTITGDPMPTHSMMLRPQDDHWSYYVTTDRENPLRQYVKLYDGDAVFELYRYQAIGLLAGCDGAPRLVWTTDVENPGSMFCMAVATHDGVMGYELLPDGCLPIEDFLPAETETA